MKTKMAILIKTTVILSGNTDFETMSLFNWIYSMTVLLFLAFQNNLGILWSEREEIETARSYLESSEALYNQYMKEVCYVAYKNLH